MAEPSHATVATIEGVGILLVLVDDALTGLPALLEGRMLADLLRGAVLLDPEQDVGRAKRARMTLHQD